MSDQLKININDGARGASFSDCGKYRWSLYRIWDRSKPQMVFLMLNPSTADHEHDDNTTTRCIGFAKSWGYGGFTIVNLFALKATEPTDLLKVDDPVGWLNLFHVANRCAKVEMVVCAWGNDGLVRKLLRPISAFDHIGFVPRHKLHYLKLSTKGCPVHPLYLPGDLKPQNLIFHGEAVIPIR